MPGDRFLDAERELTATQSPPAPETGDQTSAPPEPTSAPPEPTSAPPEPAPRLRAATLIDGWPGWWACWSCSQPVQLTPGSQQSGLAALTGALVAARTGS